ncbi:hypothetical protein CAC42_3612 [Sphaceloma murrayae]|uniref:Uncharacterized protein n=1 Tax=Sphaceloma murrayae TaxID=2082308 RepID=A0A2K1QSW2_9PEZI|nr:hypothetical protein CAC42_3612 [Sphaceloma murrayae]
MEVLAHVSARSLNKDDEKYRAQARSYVAFEGGKRLKLSGNQETTSSLGDSGRSAGTSQGLGVRDFAYIDDTQLAISALESQLLTSSLRKDAPSPTLSDKLQPERDLAKAKGDSNPALRKSVAAYVQCALKRETIRATNSTEAPTERWNGSNASQSELSIHVPLRQDGSHREWQDLPQGTLPTIVQQPAQGPREGSSSWSDDNVPVELPSTYSISDEASKKNSSSIDPFRTPTRPKFARTRSSQHNASRGTIRELPPFPNVGATELAPKPALEKPLPPKFPAHQCTELLANAKSPESSNKNRQHTVQEAVSSQAASTSICKQSGHDRPPLSRSRPSDEKITESRKSSPGLRPLTLFIQPPEPDVDIAPAPASFITEHLHMLKAKPEMRVADRYKPATVARAIRPGERGFWTFTPAEPHWSLELERDFWNFMATMVEGERVGWGVWCTRVVEVQSSDETPSESDPSTERLGQVRVYCWGEIVEHIYLLLYVASKSKVRKAQPVWCDASGKIVVTI